jgi:hypothetical protein
MHPTIEGSADYGENRSAIIGNPNTGLMAKVRIFNLTTVIIRGKPGVDFKKCRCAYRRIAV